MAACGGGGGDPGICQGSAEVCGTAGPAQPPAAPPSSAPPTCGGDNLPACP